MFLAVFYLAYSSLWVRMSELLELEAELLNAHVHSCSYTQPEDISTLFITLLYRCRRGGQMFLGTYLLPLIPKWSKFCIRTRCTYWQLFPDQKQVASCLERNGNPQHAVHRHSINSTSIWEGGKLFFFLVLFAPTPSPTLFSILFSSGSSFYFLLSVSRLVPLFRIQDAVSKSNYYGGTLGCGKGRMGRAGWEYMSIRGRMVAPLFVLRRQGNEKTTVIQQIVQPKESIFVLYFCVMVQPRGLVVKVSDYRFWGLGFDSRF
jgi:hypothetical protein